MLIEIHAIQNHSPANLNRDDLGAPKTCYFGGVLRSRISSQCIKRSIRMSKEFEALLGGVRTRQLAKAIADELGGDVKFKERAEKILEKCGIKPGESKKKEKQDDDLEEDSKESKMLVYTTREAIKEMAAFLRDNKEKDDDILAKEFAKLITEHTAAPDMALFGRMLETSKEAKETWKKYKPNIDAALQVAHAISTHAARPEVDYYVAVDDIKGEDTGAGFIDEAMFASACYYKYFSINWDTLVDNLKGFVSDYEKLAAHTVGAFIRGMALYNPTGKQNSYAANNRPDGIIIEIKESPPVSYTNAFAKPVAHDESDIITESIRHLGQYVHDLDVGYGRPKKRFWHSPNLKYPLTAVEKVGKNKVEVKLADREEESLDSLVKAVIKELGYDWEDVKKVAVIAG